MCLRDMSPQCGGDWDNVGLSRTSREASLTAQTFPFFSAFGTQVKSCQNTANVVNIKLHWLLRVPFRSCTHLAKALCRP